MHFLPDIYVPLEVFKRSYYNSERPKCIMWFEIKFFQLIPKIYRNLQTIVDIGFGYIPLGQFATTL
jgi:excinuclease ABC subunit A